VKTRTALALTAMLAIAPAIASADATAAKRADVEMKGSQVMPFSQADTMHMFRPTAAGGVQTVTVKDGDPRQIALVRSHLRKEAVAFARGDYRDPASIHGMDMPGLATLHAGAARLRVKYADVPNGAAITYVSRDPQLVSAVHRWLAAQVEQHGSHAEMRM